MAVQTPKNHRSTMVVGSKNDPARSTMPWFLYGSGYHFATLYPDSQAQLLATHGLAPWTFGGSRGVRVIKLCVNQTFAFTPDDRKLLHNSLTTGSAFRLGQENRFSFHSPVSLPVDSGLAVSPRQENRFRGWKGFRARVGNMSMGHVCVKSACGPKLTENCV